MLSQIQEIEALKKEKDAVILAHYYVPKEIQDIADYIGDSYYLSKLAATLPQSMICFCGVSFMGESAKSLSPHKTIVMPDLSADCAMAHMSNISQIEQIRQQYDDLAVVCYINSSALIKSHADVCVTSSNALKVTKALPAHNIYFIPDQNLAHYIARQLPEKNFIFPIGYCPIHNDIKKADVMLAKEKHPNALLLAHPECKEEVLQEADFIGSTSAIIDFAKENPANTFLIATEIGVFYELEKQNPDKKFYPIKEQQICADMKKNTLDKVIRSLKDESHEVHLSKTLQQQSYLPLEKMLLLAK